MKHWFTGILAVASLGFLSGCASILKPMTKDESIPQTNTPDPGGQAFSLAQPWNKELESGFRPAKVRLSWTAESLHVQAELVDDEISTRATGDNQPMWELGDVFEMFVMVEGRSDYVELHVTPNNKRLHLKLPGVGGKASPEDEPLSFEEMIVEPVGFLSSVARTKDGWSVSATIPASVLGLRELEPGIKLRVAFARYDATLGRPAILSTSANHPVVAFHRPAEWTKITLKP